MTAALAFVDEHVAAAQNAFAPPNHFGLAAAVQQVRDAK